MKTKELTKDIIRTDKMYFICPFCGKEYRALAYHTRQAHGISARDLRSMMGLKSNYQLITNEIKLKHQKDVINNAHVLNNLKDSPTRFKVGHLGHTKNSWSNQAIHELKTRKERIKNGK